MIAGAPSRVPGGNWAEAARFLSGARGRREDRELLRSDRAFQRDLATSRHELDSRWKNTRLQQISEAAANKAPKTRSRVDGSETIVEEAGPGGTWKEVSRGPRWNPNSGANDQGNDNRIQTARKTIEGLSPAQRESITDPFFADQMGPVIKQALYWSTRPLSGESADQAAAWASQYAIPQLDEPAAGGASDEVGSIYEDEEPSFWSGIRGMLDGGSR